MQGFEKKDPKGEKLFQKPEFLKPPPSDKQKLSSTIKKVENITEIVDLERESLIKTIEKLKQKANVIELILNHGSLTGKMILKNGIIIDVSFDEYTDIEAIIYLIQLTEEDLLSYLPMFLKKRLEEENLLETLESMIKYRPQDIKFEIEMEESIKEGKKIEDKQIEDKQTSDISLDELDKEIEALLLEIDKKEEVKKQQTQPQKEIEEIETLEEDIIKESINTEDKKEEKLEEIEIEKEKIEEEKEEMDNNIKVIQEDQEKTIEVNAEELVEETEEKSVEETEKEITNQEKLTENKEKELDVEEISKEDEHIEQKIEEKIESTNLINQIEYDQIEIIETIEEKVQENDEEKIKEEFEEININEIKNIDKKIGKAKKIEKREEKIQMLIDNIVNKLSNIPPLEEFHIINTESEELEYSSNESIDDFLLSTIIATFKDLSMMSSFSSESINNIVIDTNSYYQIITNIDDSRIIIAKCSKKANPSLISSLITKAIKSK